MATVRTRSHNRWSCLLRLLALLLLTLPGLTRAHPATAPLLLFADDFNDGNDAGWTQTNRQFHVVDGRYSLDGDYLPTPLTRGGWSYTHVSDPTWTDYTFNFTFDTTNAASAGNPGWPGTAHLHQASAIVRAQERQHYRVDFWDEEPYVGSGAIQLARSKDRLYDTGLAHASIAPRLGTNVGTISVVGARIRVYVNGQLAIDYTDPQPILFGGIGVGAHWEMNAWFDDITVQGVPAVPRAVPVDIKPRACPNLLRTDSLETLKVSIVGTHAIDVRSIDPASIRLEGVAPREWKLGDIATPYRPYIGKTQATDCTRAGIDGIRDLTLKFDIPTLVATLGTLGEGQVRVLHLTGQLKAAAGAGTIAGEDVVVLHTPSRPTSPPTIIQTVDFSTHGEGPFAPDFYQGRGIIFTRGDFVGFVQGDQALVSLIDGTVQPPIGRIAGMFQTPVESITVSFASAAAGTAEYRLTAYSAAGVVGEVRRTVGSDGYATLDLSNLSERATSFTLENQLVQGADPDMTSIEFGLNVMHFGTSKLTP